VHWSLRTPQYSFYLESAFGSFCSPHSFMTGDHMGLPDGPKFYRASQDLIIFLWHIVIETVWKLGCKFLHLCCFGDMAQQSMKSALPTERFS
jgi:hypothetical protein